ncbi:hypothetical protein TNCV_5006281 [Trichonephila clavipes]|uniref:Uncharacterized protein n=1 Tax=Trichonephila clavipes TaxID=2585209 RepID=A0A8X6SCF5_TRICX|nr:hypothetical protein TNCV_5006281 [Trichonephila clavipes]
MPSPVQSNCDAHDTIANGQYGAVWSMGHTQQTIKISSRTTTLATSALNNRRPASSFVKFVEGEKRWDASDHSQGVLPLNRDGREPNRTVTCMVLKATANDRRATSPLPR